MRHMQQMLRTRTPWSPTGRRALSLAALYNTGFCPHVIHCCCESVLKPRSTEHQSSMNRSYKKGQCFMNPFPSTAVLKQKQNTEETWRQGGRRDDRECHRKGEHPRQKDYFCQDQQLSLTEQFEINDGIRHTNATVIQWWNSLGKCLWK